MKGEVLIHDFQITQRVRYTMKIMENAECQLATILHQWQNQIAEHWVDLIKQIPDSHYRDLRTDMLMKSCLQGIRALYRYEEEGATDEIEQYVQQISLKRLEQGFDIREVIQALLLLHRAVLLVVDRDFDVTPAQVAPIHLELDRGLRLIVSQFSYLYSSEMNKSLELQRQQAGALAQENARLYRETQQRLEESLSLQRITSALLQERTLSDVLNVVCTEAKNLIGATGSSVLLLERDGSLHVAYSLGKSSPSQQVIPIQGSIIEKAFSTKKAGTSNLSSEEILWFENWINADESGSNLFLLAAPLIVRGKIIGALVLTKHEQPFKDDDLRIMSLFADQAAIAIENGRLTKEVEQIAIMEERNRLARDLHDSVTQSLYGVSLYAEAVARRLALEDYIGVDKYLRELKKTAMDALKEMRLLIFELRPPLLEKEGLAAALQARLDTVEGRAGLKTKLQIDIDERLPIIIEECFYRIAQEALNNVLKHAHAKRVLIEIKVSNKNAMLEIKDDGVGFLLDKALAKGGIGLTSMVERVKHLGGEIIFDSAPGKGAQVIVRLNYE